MVRTRRVGTKNVPSGSVVEDGPEHVGRVVERVVERVGVGTAALGEVRRAAPTAADLRGELAHDRAGVHVAVVGDGDDELRPVESRAQHRDLVINAK